MSDQGTASSVIRVRLLGPMEVFVDGEPIGLPGGAERALLALLLLAPGRTVSSTSLIDRLWAQATLPVDPVNALHTRVSKLRRSLAESGLDIVQRDGIGYRADLAADAIDIEDFAARIRLARSEVAKATDAPLSRHLDLYDAALALWRGDPLEDFVTEPWAANEAVRLIELRFAAITERARLGLALGHQLEVVAHLEPLVAADPTHEAMAGLLMLALYRADRQADALQTFARTRTVLDEELGLEPSASLRSLQDRVLRQDPSLSGPPEQGAAKSQLGLVGANRRPDERAMVATTLPTVIRPLIGREDQLASLRVTTDSARLVCLVGPGGAGKTVLARATAVSILPRFADGGSEVRLASVRDPDQVSGAIADALGMSIDGAAGDIDLRERLLRYLAGRRMLLLLDNCEHVIDAVSGLVDDIMGRCPGITVLATSREVLGVPGELQVLVGPLETAPEGAVAGAVADYPAARLFVERAAGVRPGVVLDDEALDAVGRITRALDGMPLAIELAAARVSLLSVVEIADRLADRFALLTSGPRTAEARQQTLRATVDWSYALLSEPERRVFNRLAVFHGGFTLAAAEEVIADDEVTAAQVLHIIGRLVERSLLIAESGRTTRYGMLETLREYAAQRLSGLGEEAELSRRHASFFSELATDQERALRGHHQREALQRLRAEHSNLRVSLSWLAGPGGDVDAALRMAGALGLFWHLGRHLEGREVLRRLLDGGSASAAARARALQAVSLVERPRACLVHPSPRCAETARESLEVFDELGDASRAALSRVLLAVEGVAGADIASSQELLSQAESQFARDEDRWGIAVIGFVRMEAALKRGDEDHGVQTGRSTAAAFRELDDVWGLSAVLYHLGWGLRQFGRNAEGARVLEEAIDVAGSAGLGNTVQWALADLGVAHINLGNLESAYEAFERCDQVSATVGDGAGAVLASYGRGLLDQLGGSWADASSSYARAAAGFVELGTPVAEGLALAGMARCDEVAEEETDAEARYRQVLEIGQESGEPGLVATAWEGLARVAQRRGEADQSSACLSRASALRASSHRPAAPYESLSTA